MNCTQNRKIVRAIVGRSVQRIGQEESEGASLVKVLRIPVNPLQTEELEGETEHSGQTQ